MSSKHTDCPHSINCPLRCAGKKISHNQRDAPWHTYTTTIGFPVMGIWPDDSDRTGDNPFPWTSMGSFAAHLCWVQPWFSGLRCRSYTHTGPQIAQFVKLMITATKIQLHHALNRMHTPCSSQLSSFADYLWCLYACSHRCEQHVPSAARCAHLRPPHGP